MKNKPASIDKYILVPTTDGVQVAFPVSKHVLRVGDAMLRDAGASFTRVRRWRPSFVQKISSLVLMISLCISSFGVTYGELDNTLAYLRDDEVSEGNVLQAGALDFMVTPDGDVSAIIEAGQHLVIPIMTPEPGTFPTMYRVTATTTEPVAPLCAALDATATTSPFTYGPADLLALAVVATTTSGPWPLELSLPSALGLTNGDECIMELVYRGWHKDVPENTGYTDEERFLITVTYTEEELIDFNIVLNEFLPFPNGVAYDFDFGNDGSNMPQGEWIELFNKGDEAVDVENWYITDASGGGGNTHAVINNTNTNTGDTIILPGGWLVVYMNKPTLNNVSDEIHLYTDNDVEVDFVSYEQPSDGCFKEPSPGETNPPDLPTGEPGNGNQADCNQAQVAPNKSYARIPDGTGAWVDPIPTPGSFNIPDPVEPPQEMQAEPEEETAPAEEVVPDPVPEESANEPEPTPTPAPGGGPAAVSDITPPAEIEESAEENGNEAVENGAPPADEQQPAEEPADESAPEQSDEATLPESHDEPVDTPQEPAPEPTPEPDSTSSPQAQPSTEPTPPADVPPPPPPVEPPPAETPTE